MQMLENFAQPHECSLTAFVSIPFPVTVLQAKLDWFVSAAHIQDDIDDSIAINTGCDSSCHKEYTAQISTASVPRLIRIPQTSDTCLIRMTKSLIGLTSSASLN